MTPQPTPSTAALWARFRFSVIGALLSAPPVRGELKGAIQSLAEKIWTHPITGREVQYSATTIGAISRSQGLSRCCRNPGLRHAARAHAATCP